jgi:hypothetical protein
MKTHDSPMKTHDSPSETKPAECIDKLGFSADRCWQIAMDRVLLYLRCLGFPAREALDLAMRALEAAEVNNSRSVGTSPVGESMRALHEFMKKREVQIPSTPPLHRLHMIPEEGKKP